MTVIHADNDLEYWARDYWLGHCEGFHVEDEDAQARRRRGDPRRRGRA